MILFGVGNFFFIIGIIQNHNSKKMFTYQKYLKKLKFVNWMQKKYDLTDSLTRKISSSIKKKENNWNRKEFIDLFYKPLRERLESVYYKKEVSDQFSFLKKIDNKIMINIGRKFEKKVYHKGEIISNSSFNTDIVFFLKKGKINLYYGDHPKQLLINEIISGSILNEFRMFYSNKMKFTYVVESDVCEVFSIKFEEFWKIFIFKYPLIGKSLIEITNVNWKNQMKIISLINDFFNKDHFSIGEIKLEDDDTEDIVASNS